MPVVADTEPLVIVALVAGAILIVAIAISLVVVTRVLRQLAARLENVVGTTGGPPPPQEAASDEDAMETLKRNLEIGQALLESERERRGAVLIGLAITPDHQVDLVAALSAVRSRHERAAAEARGRAAAAV